MGSLLYPIQLELVALLCIQSIQDGIEDRLVNVLGQIHVDMCIVDRFYVKQHDRNQVQPKSNEKKCNVK